MKKLIHSLLIFLMVTINISIPTFANAAKPYEKFVIIKNDYTFENHRGGAVKISNPDGEKIAILADHEVVKYYNGGEEDTRLDINQQTHYKTIVSVDGEMILTLKGQSIKGKGKYAHFYTLTDFYGDLIMAYVKLPGKTSFAINVESFENDVERKIKKIVDKKAKELGLSYEDLISAIESSVDLTAAERNYTQAEILSLALNIDVAKVVKGKCVNGTNILGGHKCDSNTVVVPTIEVPTGPVVTYGEWTGVNTVPASTTTYSPWVGTAGTNVENVDQMRTQTITTPAYSYTETRTVNTDGVITTETRVINVAESVITNTVTQNIPNPAYLSYGEWMGTNPGGTPNAPTYTNWVLETAPSSQEMVNQSRTETIVTPAYSYTETRTVTDADGNVTTQMRMVDVEEMISSMVITEMTANPDYITPRGVFDNTKSWTNPVGTAVNTAPIGTVVHPMPTAPVALTGVDLELSTLPAYNGHEWSVYDEEGGETAELWEESNSLASSAVGLNNLDTANLVNESELLLQRAINQTSVAELKTAIANTSFATIDTGTLTAAQEIQYNLYTTYNKWRSITESLSEAQATLIATINATETTISNITHAPFTGYSVVIGTGGPSAAVANSNTYFDAQESQITSQLGSNSYTDAITTYGQYGDNLNMFSADVLRRLADISGNVSTNHDLALAVNGLANGLTGNYAVFSQLFADAYNRVLDLSTVTAEIMPALTVFNIIDGLEDYDSTVSGPLLAANPITGVNTASTSIASNITAGNWNQALLDFRANHNVAQTNLQFHLDGAETVGISTNALIQYALTDTFNASIPASLQSYATSFNTAYDLNNTFITAGNQLTEHFTDYVEDLNVLGAGTAIIGGVGQFLEYTNGELTTTIQPGNNTAHDTFTGFINNINSSVSNLDWNTANINIANKVSDARTILNRFNDLLGPSIFGVSVEDRVKAIIYGANSVSGLPNIVSHLANFVTSFNNLIAIEALEAQIADAIAANPILSFYTTDGTVPSDLATPTDRNTRISEIRTLLGFGGTNTELNTIADLNTQISSDIAYLNGTDAIADRIDFFNDHNTLVAAEKTLEVAQAAAAVAGVATAEINKATLEAENYNADKDNNGTLDAAEQAAREVADAAQNVKEASEFLSENTGGTTGNTVDADGDINTN